MFVESDVLALGLRVIQANDGVFVECIQRRIVNVAGELRPDKVSLIGGKGVEDDVNSSEVVH